MRLEEIKPIKEAKKPSEDSTKGLEKYVDAKNWPSDLEQAKAFGKQAVSHFKFKDKIPKFKMAINKANSVAKVQFIVINAIMSGEGKAVIK